MTTFYSSVPHLPHKCTSYSETTSPSAKKPSVILLTECHSKEDNILCNAYLIKSLYKPGDTVLLEQATENVSQDFINRSFLDETKMTIHGWDDSTATKQILEVQNVIEILATQIPSVDQSNSMQKKILDPRAIKDFPDSVRELIETAQHLLNRLNESVVSITSEDRRHLIISTKQPEIFFSLTGIENEILDITFKKRQISLCEKIKQYAKSNNTVFVVAGTDHLLTYLEQKETGRRDNSTDKTRTCDQHVLLFRSLMDQNNLSFHVLDTGVRDVAKSTMASIKKDMTPTTGFCGRVSDMTSFFTNIVTTIVNRISSLMRSLIRSLT